MDGIWLTPLTLLTLLASACIGLAVQPMLADHHRSRASAEVVWPAIGMIITFSALVLGLLISSEKATFDLAHHDRAEFAADLVQFDTCLRNYGSDADPVRRLMVAYTAASIASTWPDEKPPEGLDMVDLGKIPRAGESLSLGNLLNRAEMALRTLPPSDAMHQKLGADCLDRFHNLTRQRWTVIAETSGLAGPFYAMLVFWMAIIFAAFGIFAPRNLMVMSAIGLCAICLASAMFVIAELDSPYTGLISIPSDAMRSALADMRR